MQLDSHVSYQCTAQKPLLSLQDWNPITLLESRAMIAGSQNTGHRTWEGALHLGSYLLTAGRQLVNNRTILELGAGTGFLSILCAKYLSVNHVTATDGDKLVLDALVRNLDLNGLGSSPNITVHHLCWGQDLEGAPYDVVIGADIVHMPCLDSSVWFADRSCRSMTRLPR